MADSRNEPSMDEILASIKRIIADDDRNQPIAQRKAKSAVSDVEEDEVLDLTDADHNAPNGDILLDNNKAQSLRHSFSALQTLAEPGAAPRLFGRAKLRLKGLRVTCCVRC